jgi:hypothetical protein
MLDNSFETNIIITLKSIGARELARTIQRRASQKTSIVYFQLNNRLIEVGRNITDGLWVNVSEKYDAIPESAKWHSIFELTVPNFNKFDDTQKLDWLLSVPTGEQYMGFLQEHIILLAKIDSDYIVFY